MEIKQGSVAQVEPALEQVLPDIQAGADNRGVSLSRVGISKVRWPLTLPLRDGGSFSTVAELSLTVSLSDHKVGIHMSRLLQSLVESTDKFTPQAVDVVLAELRKRLDAKQSQLTMSFPIFLERKAPVTGHAGLLDYDCLFEAVYDDWSLDRVAGVRANVTTLCPCSKEISRFGAHNQRSCVQICVRQRHNELVYFEDLIDIAESSASCQLYPVLKRPDEKHVTERAYENPRFVEDAVREAVLLVRERIAPKISWFSVSSENYESIHSHNAYAYVEFGDRGPHSWSLFG